MIKILFLLTLTGAVVFLIIAFPYLKMDSKNQILMRIETTVEEEPIHILLWTPIEESFSNWKVHFTNNFTHYELNSCQSFENRSASISTAESLHVDSKVLARADVIIFNLNDLQINDFSNYYAWKESVLPSSRTSGQIWALFWREPPSKINI